MATMESLQLAQMAADISELKAAVRSSSRPTEGPFEIIRPGLVSTRTSSERMNKCLTSRHSKKTKRALW